MLQCMLDHDAPAGVLTVVKARTIWMQYHCHACCSACSIMMLLLLLSNPPDAASAMAWAAIAALPLDAALEIATPDPVRMQLQTVGWCCCCAQRRSN